MCPHLVYWLHILGIFFIWKRSVKLSHYYGPPSEVLGAAVSHKELWSEVPGARPLHTIPYEQVELDESQKKRKRNLWNGASQSYFTAATSKDVFSLCLVWKLNSLWRRRSPLEVYKYTWGVKRKKAMWLTGSWCSSWVSGLSLWSGRAEFRTLHHQRPHGPT